MDNGVVYMTARTAGVSTSCVAAYHRRRDVAKPSGARACQITKSRRYRHPLNGGQGLPTVVNILMWFWALAGLIAFSPTAANAVGSKGVRETAKGKTTPTSNRKSTKTHPTKFLFNQQEVDPAVDPLEIREHVIHRTRPGDTLPSLLARFGLALKERQLWTSSFKRNYSIRGIPSGREIHFYFSKAPDGQRPSPDRLRAVEFELDDDSTLTWEKGPGGIFFQKQEKPYDVELKTVGVSIENSVFEDGHKAGIHSKLLSQLADIFTWDVDLDKDIRHGDSFKIVYEKRSRKGQQAKSSLRILAAELINAGQKLTAVYFEKQKGQGNYYNLEGRSLARAFLRFPLEFASITSQFTESRFHPLLKANLPHTGVDFAAQRGTPVRAIADGRVAQAGWNGGYGKLVEIQHDSTYTSRYAHLGSFASGVREGAAVKKGQIIGYVGSTGRSTGPHLHFELYKDQQYVDPLTVDLPSEDIIEPTLQKMFENQKQLLLVELTSAPQS
jgi:murein DD-endopeptidase MepM/ murein hydrolase activator NlpD